MSIENKENKKKFYLITLIPEWSSGKHFTICKINNHQWKLFKRQYWKYRIVYPILETFHYSNSENFNDDLRELLILLENRRLETKKRLDHLLERRF